MQVVQILELIGKKFKVTIINVTESDRKRKLYILGNEVFPQKNLKH